MVSAEAFDLDNWREQRIGLIKELCTDAAYLVEMNEPTIPTIERKTPKITFNVTPRWFLVGSARFDELRTII